MKEGIGKIKARKLMGQDKKEFSKWKKIKMKNKQISYAKAVTYHQQTNAQCSPQTRATLERLPQSFTAKHDIKWYGITHCSVQVSFPGCVTSHPLTHPSPCDYNSSNEKLLKCSYSQNRMVFIVSEWGKIKKIHYIWHLFCLPKLNSSVS